MIAPDTVSFHTHSMPLTNPGNFVLPNHQRMIMANVIFSVSGAIISTTILFATWITNQ